MEGGSSGRGYQWTGVERVGTIEFYETVSYPEELDRVVL